MDVKSYNASNHDEPQNKIKIHTKNEMVFGIVTVSKMW